MSDPEKRPAIGQLVAAQKTAVITALADAGLSPNPVVGAALFEIGAQLLIAQGLNPDALSVRLREIALGTEARRLGTATQIH